MKDYKKIKDHYSNKIIAPSENSWNKLNEMLNQKESKKNKKMYFFKYAMVACFFLLGFVLWFSINNNTNFTPENEVVIEQKSDLEIKKPENSTVKEKLEKNNKIINIIENQKVITKNEKRETNNLKSTIIENLPIEIENINIDNNKNNEENLKKFEEIAITNTALSTKITIDPNLLLQAAENDLNEEHRDKTIQKLKNGFNQIKTYVNNVNYQNN